MMFIGPGADKEWHRRCCDILRRHPAQKPLNLELGHMVGQSGNRLPQLRRQGYVSEQLIN